MFHDLIRPCTCHDTFDEFRLFRTRRVIMYRINNYSFRINRPRHIFPGGRQAHVTRIIRNNNNNSYGNGISVGEWNELDLIVTQNKKLKTPPEATNTGASRCRCRPAHTLSFIDIKIIPDENQTDPRPLRPDWSSYFITTNISAV